MNSEEHIKEGLKEHDLRYSEYHEWTEWYPNSNISKDYSEYEPYLYMDENDFFNIEHNSNYKLKEVC